MKPRLVVLTLGLAMALGGGGLGCAHQGQRVADQQTQGIYLTGSYLPQQVEINGPVSNGQDKVRVIDRSEIERTGGADVSQTLRMLGATR